MNCIQNINNTTVNNSKKIAVEFNKHTPHKKLPDV